MLPKYNVVDGSAFSIKLVKPNKEWDREEEKALVFSFAVVATTEAFNWLTDRHQFGYSHTTTKTPKTTTKMTVIMTMTTEAKTRGE